MRSHLRISLSANQGNFLQSRLRIEDALCGFADNHKFIDKYSLSCLSKDNDFFCLEFKFVSGVNSVDCCNYVISFIDSLRFRFFDVYHIIRCYTYHSNS